MKTFQKLSLALFLLVLLSVNSFGQKYQPDWSSLVRHQTPKWLQDGKFGIYTHWGIFSVAAHGRNTTWYSNALYRDPHSDARKDFEERFGKLTPDFGWKDLIPKFTAEKFNADEWAKLFKEAGAKFAGPVAEHHDGFAMWDTKWSKWNAAKMGPKRDIVGELEKAYKKAGLKYLTAFHHAENWDFFPVWDKRYDTGNPKYSGLYGQPHKPGEKRNQAFIDEWYGKVIEVIDKYDPDFIWFDFALDNIPEGYIKDFLAYYYNKALAEGKDVIVSYKQHDLVPGAGIRDLELGQEPRLTYNDWITDTSIDDRGAWGWATNLTFKTPNRLIDNLVDRVSKNGYLLLNVGPKPDGTIPEGAKKVLLEMGSWLKQNGEAIYGTTPWFIPGEGPTNLGETNATGFNEKNIVYTSKDIRFTVKGDVLYAIFLDWPGDKAVITTLREPSVKVDVNKLPQWARPGKSFSLVGTKWEIKDGKDKVKYEFYKNGKFKVSGGDAGSGLMGKYRQFGENVYLQVGGDNWAGKYDGKKFRVVDQQPKYNGFYKEEIKRITLLGYDKDLDWVMTPQGLVIKTPKKKIGKYAYVFKIERYHHPKIK